MSGADVYSVLFEPVKIGPVTARNRFYQVPHCNGLGHLRPQAEAAMRAMKAEGGWAVVSTQEAEIHPTSDLSPYSENRIWDDQDIPALRLITNSIHEKGSLAAIQLAHNGHHAQNHLTRAPLLAPSELVLQTPYPKQARAMDKADIREFRKWHRAAARRSREAGFDIVYVYAGHHMTLPHHFLLPQFNDRTDEYGGSLENRVRLTRELLEETKEEVGDDCAIALRFAVDEMLGSEGMQAQEEGRAVVELLAQLPDLWDVNVADWSNDSATTRFEPRDGFQTSYIEFVKQVTSKPVVGVGRLTSPDLMASLVRKGILDFIGAARPSIADPFLPNKIREDRIEEIRECIGCNICVSSDSLGVPIRCTQNPTMGEEWRRKWHPEIIERRVNEEAALVVGSGPAGLECAMQLARRGYEVTLAEAKQEFGGRVMQETALTGLSAWKRVTDHRIYDLQQRGNVQLFTDSRLSASEVIELGIPNVFVATGAKWRRDGRGKSAFHGAPIGLGSQIFTPDDIVAGVMPQDGPIVVYDDDQAYLGGVLADHLAQVGREVVFVTPASIVSPFTELTLEQTKVQRSLLEKGVRLNLSQTLAGVAPGQATLQCVYTGRENSIECSSVVLVTQRMRETTLYDELCGLTASPLKTLELIGDAANPGLIADAVYSGHMAARNFERNADDIDREFFRREVISLESA
ncbi:MULTISPECIES: FAD-dependent oxidoreductase [unclassified Ruegeria]|uniref:oxidoreductase n=1 Tax=unclassified Ruegeria TaxID=2625375 RepID=UPI0014911A0F|nr:MULTISPECIES: FAD-dependent oxidoreductase [unclassified Ruegeria]NOD36754.1 FAD-dependent oxidoreductase [Ruegeria sp. HKCCD7296]NOE43913.1 FAD-dependent oxidoreductase [Ruegeria sp. HKCCD7319]